VAAPNAAVRDDVEHERRATFRRTGRPAPDPAAPAERQARRGADALRGADAVHGPCSGATRPPRRALAARGERSGRCARSRGRDRAARCRRPPAEPPSGSAEGEEPGHSRSCSQAKASSEGRRGQARGRQARRGQTFGNRPREGKAGRFTYRPPSASRPEAGAGGVSRPSGHRVHRVQATGARPSRVRPSPVGRRQPGRHRSPGGSRAGRDRPLDQRPRASQRALPPPAPLARKTTERPAGITAERRFVYPRGFSRAIVRPRAVGGGTTCEPIVRRGESVPLRTVAL
jgi:hypothetical protein